MTVQYLTMQKLDDTLETAYWYIYGLKRPNESILRDLSYFVKISAAECDLRSDLLASLSTIEKLATFLRFNSFENFKHDHFQKLLNRILRGVFLIIRNISISVTFLIKDVAAILRNVLSCSFEDHMELLLVDSLMQTLANLIMAHEYLLSSESAELCHLLEFFIGKECLREKSISQAFFLVLRLWLQENEGNYIVLIQNHTFYFYDSMSVTLLETLKEIKPDDINQDLLCVQSVLVSKPEFSKWVLDILKSPLGERCIASLRFSQMSITQEESWKECDAENILSWVIPALETYSSLADQSLQQENPQTLNSFAIFRGLEASLDIMSHISSLGLCLHTLRSQPVLRVLVCLLRFLQENSPQHKLSSNHDAAPFPGIKSIIIEILGYLCHRSLSVQNTLRELHCLELILSNCVIDKNDPYIRERSILCLRYLLEGNEQNQLFVALLEAKLVTNESALQNAGLQVEIKDGKVQMKGSVQKPIK